MANAFTCQMIPFTVSTYIFLQPNYTNQDNLYFQQITIMFSNMFSVICITFLLFVHWKKGPALWTKISPFIFFAVAILNYLVIPLSNILIAIYCFASPNFDIT